MNHWITVFNNLFKTSKNNNLEMILESDGELSAPSSSNYTTINHKLQTNFLPTISKALPPNSTKQSTTSNYNPPSKIPSTSTNKHEESPFSKFKIWGQKY